MSNVSTIISACSSSLNTTDMSMMLECILSAQEAYTSNVTATAISDASTAASAALGDVAGGLNSFFLIIMGALVYFMQPGFAFLCAGSVRQKNVSNILLYSMLDSAGGGVAYWAIGYALAYGGDALPGGKSVPGQTFVGSRGFFLQNDNIEMQFWFFQFCFASALSSIVAGTVAERMKVQAYCMYSVFLCGFVYPVVSHAFWSRQGFLSPIAYEPLWGVGAIDLAGSGPVHMAGGVAALMGAIILGPRIGRFYDEDGIPLETPREFKPHSTALQFLGTFCLWFGWYGFNPGSVLLINTSGLGRASARVTVNTTLAACTGAVSALFTSTLYDYWVTGVHTYDTTYTMNGCLAGLAAVTGPCATIDSWGAVIVGIVAGWLYLLGSKILIKLRIDDAVDAIPVHLVGGMWGEIAGGLLTQGPFLQETWAVAPEHVGWFVEFTRGSTDFSLMGCQLAGIGFIIGWVSVTMGIYFMFLRMIGWLRVDPLEEEVGMDLSRHKIAAYDLQAPAESDVEKLSSSRHKSLEVRSFMDDSKKKEYDANVETA